MGDELLGEAWLGPGEVGQGPGRPGLGSGNIPQCETARHGGARPGKQACHIKNPVLNVRLDGPRA